MKNKYIFTAVLLLVLTLAGAFLTGLFVSRERGAGPSDEFQVVTSFYPMYIAAVNVIGSCEGVSLQNLSEPQTGCLHDYQLTTEDMVRLSEADVFIINGGGMESFLEDAAEQYPQLSVIDAGGQVSMIEDNAHMWMSIADYRMQVQTIAEGLSGKDPRHRDVYETNSRQYLEKLDELRMQQEALRQECLGKNIIIFHEAFAYTARDCGFSVSGSMDLDEEQQVSAGETAQIIQKIREKQASLILAEETYGRQMCETVGAETGIRAVYLDPCVRGSYDPDSYLEAMGQNIERIRQALKE